MVSHMVQICMQVASRPRRGSIEAGLDGPRWVEQMVQIFMVEGPSSSPFGPESKFKNHSHLSESERCGLVLKLCWLSQANILATLRKLVMWLK